MSYLTCLMLSWLFTTPLLAESENKNLLRWCRESLIELTQKAPKNIELETIIGATPEFLLNQKPNKLDRDSIKLSAEISAENLIEAKKLVEKLITYLLNLAPHLDASAKRILIQIEEDTDSNMPHLQLDKNIQAAFYFLQFFDYDLAQKTAHRFLELYPDSEGILKNQSLTLIQMSDFYLGEAILIPMLKLTANYAPIKWKSFLEKASLNPDVLDLDQIKRSIDFSIEYLVKLSQEETTQTAAILFKSVSPGTDLFSGTEDRNQQNLFWARLQRLDEAKEIADAAAKFFKKVGRRNEANEFSNTSKLIKEQMNRINKQYVTLFYLQ